MIFIANYLTSKEDKEHLSKVFIQLDVNNDGKLSKDEIYKGLKQNFKYLSINESEI